MTRSNRKESVILISKWHKLKTILCCPPDASLIFIFSPFLPSRIIGEIQWTLFQAIADFLLFVHHWMRTAVSSDFPKGFYFPARAFLRFLFQQYRVLSLRTSYDEAISSLIQRAHHLSFGFMLCSFEKIEWVAAASDVIEEIRIDDGHS